MATCSTCAWTTRTTLQLLRDGSVLGAVTAESQPVKGCNVHPLGAMRYHAIASPGFARQYFNDGMQAAAWRAHRCWCSTARMNCNGASCGA